MVTGAGSRSMAGAGTASGGAVGRPPTSVIRPPRSIVISRMRRRRVMSRGEPWRPAEAARLQRVGEGVDAHRPVARRARSAPGPRCTISSCGAVCGSIAGSPFRRHLDPWTALRQRGAGAGGAVTARGPIAGSPPRSRPRPRPPRRPRRPRRRHRRPRGSSGRGGSGAARQWTAPSPARIPARRRNDRRRNADAEAGGDVAHRVERAVVGDELDDVARARRGQPDAGGHRDAQVAPVADADRRRAVDELGAVAREQPRRVVTDHSPVADGDELGAGGRAVDGEMLDARARCARRGSCSRRRRRSRGGGRDAGGRAPAAGRAPRRPARACQRDFGLVLDELDRRRRQKGENLIDRGARTPRPGRAGCPATGSGWTWTWPADCAGVGDDVSALLTGLPRMRTGTEGEMGCACSCPERIAAFAAAAKDRARPVYAIGHDDPRRRTVRITAREPGPHRLRRAGAHAPPLHERALRVRRRAIPTPNRSPTRA